MSSVWEKAPAAYRDQLIPNFAYGTKRPVFDVDYLQTCMFLSFCFSNYTCSVLSWRFGGTVHRHNVTLYFEAIKSLAQTSVICQTGVAIKADIIIAAIGKHLYFSNLALLGQLTWFLTTRRL